MNDVRVLGNGNRTELTIVVAAAFAVVIGLLVRTHAGSATLRPVSVAVISSNPIASLDGLAPRPGKVLFSLDTVSVNRHAMSAADGKVISIRSGDNVSVMGWAADGIAGVAANAVFAAIGTQRPSALAGGGRRPDVAEALGNPKLSKTGFSGKLVTSGLPEGTYPLRFFIVDAAAASYEEVPSPLSITVK